MQEIVLKTKLHIPTTRSECISRPQLIDKLSGGLNHKLILVSAPAGFGKSTIISEWIRQSELLSPEYKTTWISLDEGDNDLQRFISYFAAAFELIDHETGIKIQSLLQEPELPAIDNIVQIIVNEIQTLPVEILFVLDDYHIIENREIHKLIALFLDYLPPQIHLVLCMRSDPFLPISRLRAGNQITEIREKDLRFTHEESTRFLTKMAGQDLTENQIETLEKRTEGWIAGLQLAALSLKEQNDPSTYIQAFSGDDRYVMDYLVDEVISIQPPYIQDFLYRTSILNRFNSSLCNVLATTKMQENGEIIDYLERSNLFLISLDNNRHWYRYHHLFSDILLNRLSQSQPDLIKTLHNRASVWFEENELIIEAVHHALKAEDNDRAALLVEKNAMDLLAQGELHEILKFYNLLPEYEINNRPWLCIYFAWALMFRGHMDEVESILKYVDSEEPEITGNISAIHAYMNVATGNYVKAMELAKISKELLSKDNHSVLSTVIWVLGYVNLLFGQLTEAGNNFKEVIKLGRLLKNPWTVINGMTDLANVYMASGKLRNALSLYREAIEFSAGKNIQHFGYMGRVETGLAHVLYEMNDLIEAEQYTRSSIKKIKQWENPNHDIYTYDILAQIQITEKKYKEAGETLDQADKIIQNFSVLPFLNHNIEYIRVRLWLTLKKGNFLSNWISDNPITNNQNTPIRILLIHARILMGKKQYKEALKLLEIPLKQAEEKKLQSLEIEILILQSLLFQSLNETERAIKSLKKGLRLGELEGFVRLFVNEGYPLKNLLSRIVKHKPVNNYASKLLPLFENTRSIIMQKPLSGLIEPLSERELDVLRFLKSDLTGPEIAEKLYISLSTVRTHTKNIYEKLGVNNRRAAVTRARELEI